MSIAKNAILKAEIDGVTSEKIAAWDAAQANAKEYADGLNAAMNDYVVIVENAKHTNDNKDAIDDITAAKVASWDSNAKMYFSASDPANLSANDLWVQIVE